MMEDLDVCKPCGCISPRLIDTIYKKISLNEKFFSLEFFPPKTSNGLLNLLTMVDRMTEGSPLFIDVTWQPNNSVEECNVNSRTMNVAHYVTNGLHTTDSMIHIPCGMFTTMKLREILMEAHNLGIANVLALQEDSLNCDQKVPDNEVIYDCTDLVRFIRKEFGEFFTICIAGYHPAWDSYETDLLKLKEEVEAGADFIISQLFFKAETFLKFVDDCQCHGITVPIIPGILPIQSHTAIRQLKKVARVEIPANIMDDISSMKDDDEAIMAYGINYAVKMCKELLENAHVHGLHFYTLNRETATQKILKRLGLWDETSPTEEYSYLPAEREPLQRLRRHSGREELAAWSEFPNGRWGNSNAPSFGELKDYHLFFVRRKADPGELRRMWGEELKSETDVYNVFACYVSGKENEQGVKVSYIPWNDDDLAAETKLLSNRLEHLNSHGILTINSQPQANSIPSSDNVLGWGSPGGYVFQKAYLEFFASENMALSLYKILQQYPFLSYHLVNASGTFDKSNADQHNPNAVTWGIFPGKAVVQPTVVDPVGFRYWKDEAFGLWTQRWGNLYPEGSKSRQIINTIHDSFYLINIVDNDYIAGNGLWEVLDKVLVEQGHEPFEL